jgi:hypothetical protein
MKNSSDTIRNRTRELPACSRVPQPTDTETCNIHFISSIQSSTSLTAYHVIKEGKKAHQQYYTVLSTDFSMVFIVLFHT